MQIDITKPFTTEDVANLLASKDDSQHRQVRVTKAGMAYLSDEVGNQNIGNLAFRLETFVAGSGYVGDREDTKFAQIIERVLKKNWPHPSSTYIDDFS